MARPLIASPKKKRNNRKGIRRPPTEFVHANASNEINCALKLSRMENVIKPSTCLKCGEKIYSALEISSCTVNRCTYMSECACVSVCISCSRKCLRLKDIRNRNYTLHCSKFALTHTDTRALAHNRFYIQKQKKNTREKDPNGSRRGRKREMKRAKKVNRRQIRD